MPEATLEVQDPIVAPPARPRPAERVLRKVRVVIHCEPGNHGGREPIPGKTVDIGVTGASIITKCNLRCPQTAKVFLLLDDHPLTIVEAKSQIVGSVFSSKQGGFRLTVEFTEFEGNGRRLFNRFLVGN